jgi:hypothetical protein
MIVEVSIPGITSLGSISAVEGEEVLVSRYMVMDSKTDDAK